MEIQSDRQSDEYFIIPNGASRVGSLALRNFFNDLANIEPDTKKLFIELSPQDSETREIMELTEVLLNPNVPLSSRKLSPRSLELTTEETIARGRWLGALMAQSEVQTALTPAIIRRASKLGIINSYDTLVRKFENGFAGFREAIESEPPRSGRFDSWMVKDFVLDVLKTAKENGTKPNKRILKERSKLNPDKPSPQIMVGRFGTLDTLYELSGYSNPDLWEEQDYIDWGIKFIMANARAPLGRDMNLLSKRGVAPASGTFSNHFGSLKKYKTEVEVKHAYKLFQRQQQLRDITARIESGQLPVELFRTTRDRREILSRYAKYSMLMFAKTPSLRNLTEKAKVNLSLNYDDLIFIVMVLDTNETTGNKKDTPRLARQLLTKRRRLFLDNYKSDLKLDSRHQFVESNFEQMAA